MSNRITRRQALKVVSGAVLLPVACGQLISTKISKAIFRHGVASGDPDQSSVVIWTRVSDVVGPVNVDWLVATDPGFLNAVARGTFTTYEQRDHTVKVVVALLKPGQEYFYKFETGAAISPIGRTKTLADGHLENVVLAVATCANYSFGHFNVYDVIAKDPSIDMIVHLGDYIYEHGPDAYGGEAGKRLGRNHQPSHEIITLEDYRIRHAQYKTDPGSLAMHARHPLIVIWDDHETTNNPWMGGASNHQANEGSWQARRTASLRAYYEWLPIRDPENVIDQKNYWRHYKFGDLLSLITLESRHTGRSQQISYSQHSHFLKTPNQAQEFLTSVVGAPERNMLSKDMETFLSKELKESVAASRRWRVIANQTMMAKSIDPKLDDAFFKELRKELSGGNLEMLEGHQYLGSLDLPSDLDTWDGYPAARERFYQLAKDSGVTDLLVVTGDSHSYWANELYDAGGQPMGVELGATGITSPRSIMSLGAEAMKRYDELNTANNKEIVWSDGRHNGYIKLQLDHQTAHADYVTVSTVESIHYETQVVHSVDIINHNDTLVYK
ncbi:MAG: alkaline phosphatase D [Enterobacterales bacterium]|jgi:alkaline phosphatase D